MIIFFFQNIFLIDVKFFSNSSIMNNILGDGKYNASLIVSSKLTVYKKTTSIKASDAVFKAKEKSKVLTVTLKITKNPYDGKTYIKNAKKLFLTVRGKKYTARINSNGVAKFRLNLASKGEYRAKISFEGDKTYEPSSKKIKITVK